MTNYDLFDPPPRRASAARPPEAGSQSRAPGPKLPAAAPLRYGVLASGSAGNACWVGAGDARVLIDCGLSMKALQARLAEVGERLDDFQAVLCTHGHGDHVSGVGALARRWGLEVWGSPATLARVRGLEPALARPLPQGPGAALRFGSLELRWEPTAHDAPGSVAYFASSGGARLGVITDLGSYGAPMVAAAAACDALVLEFNHDLEALLDGPYPAHLKRRVAGPRGHLSNRQAGQLLEAIGPGRLRQLTLAHLSEKNNTPAWALAAAEGACEGVGLAPALWVAAQGRPGPAHTCPPGPGAGPADPLQPPP